jgi:hypothetical protein
MQTRIKKKKSIPIELLRALYSFIIIFCIPGLIVTFVAPSFTIELARVNQERVDATVSKNLWFIVPISRHTATNVIDTESETIDSGLIRRSGSIASTGLSTGKITGEAEDNGHLLLKGREGEAIEVWISPVSLDDVEDEIHYFITESKEPSLRLWVVSNWKFGVLLPGGILLLWAIVFFMTVWSIITGKALERDSA